MVAIRSNRPWPLILIAFSLILVFLIATSSSRSGRDGFISKQWLWHSQNDEPTSHPSSTTPDNPTISPVQEEENATDGSEEPISMTETLNSYLTGDIDVRLPTFPITHLTHLRPHNYRGPGHPAFALYYASRNATDQNSYFIAMQQIVYRLLWDPHIKSRRYPVIVFVAPFVTQRQRDYFAAAGALVRELELVEFHAVNTSWRLDHRFRDVMAKLLMWRETEFSRIAFLDGDAFPWANVDGIMEEGVAPRRECRRELLSVEEEEVMGSDGEECEYVFAALTESGPDHFVNAGVMVFRPDVRLGDLLVALSHQQDRYNNLFPEQGPLTLFYRQDGPFPSTELSPAWNGETKRISLPGEDTFIVHSKIWTQHWSPESWVMEDFNATWETMLAVYESKRFLDLREEDDRGRDEPPVNEGLPVKP